MARVQFLEVFADPVLISASSSEAWSLSLALIFQLRFILHLSSLFTSLFTWPFFGSHIDCKSKIIGQHCLKLAITFCLDGHPHAWLARSLAGSLFGQFPSLLTETVILQGNYIYIYPYISYHIMSCSFQHQIFSYFL